ncbi:cellulase/cellobiase CelA1 [Hamadaea flava]|uniref:Cellulose binding domain-containing protein n=1 Tax=Hamadaea flava TaxID=1742688 RepID=A0ABV8LIN5_9ACTN|nr:cellulose binding domain-containing protein [Hamadaea flava]MCP2325027.1 cellulase/cellobiase CelA1 [Hamadaea flava]
MNVPGPVRWWTPRQPGWLRNTVIAVIVGLAAGFGVLAVVAPLSPDPDAVAGGTPPASPSPSSYSLSFPMVSLSPSALRTPSRSRSASPSAESDTAGVAARYGVKESWSGGYSAEIVITAIRATADWTIVLTMPDGVNVSTAWEADYRQNGRTVTLSPKSWNRTLAAGTQIVAGFQARGSQQPLSCAINATPCA